MYFFELPADIFAGYVLLLNGVESPVLDDRLVMVNQEDYLGLMKSGWVPRYYWPGWSITGAERTP